MKIQFSNSKLFLFPLSAVLFIINSCGSFSPVGYYNDGIYGDPLPPKKQYSNNNDGKYYKKYFGDKAKELADNNRNVEADSLSTPTLNNRDVENIKLWFFVKYVILRHASSRQRFFQTSHIKNPKHFLISMVHTHVFHKIHSKF